MIRQDILAIIGGYLNDDYNYEIKSNIDDILSIAGKLRILDIVSYSLKKKGVNNSLLDESLLSNVRKLEIKKNERLSISKVLDEALIDYVFIKGLTLSKYYTVDYLRYSSDIDIVVNKNDFNKAKELLIDKLKYKEVEYIRTNETSLFNNNCSVDLHYMYMKDEDIIEDILESCDKVDHELKDEYKYLLLIAHSKKHFEDGLLEFRLFIDLYHMNKLDLDRSLINDLLIKCDLLEYYKGINAYLDYLLNNKESRISELLSDFIFDMALDNGRSNRVLLNNNGRGFKYVFKRVFLDYKTLSKYYPLLRRYKVLLPYYEVKRWLLIVFRGELKSGLNEIKAINNLDNDSYSKMNELKKLLGI